MDAQQIDRFLDAYDAVPDYFREHIRRVHIGERAYWRAHSMLRGDCQIVEVAEDLGTFRYEDRFAVIIWNWHAQGYTMRWCTFSTLVAANKHRDRMFRIDLIYSDLRA